jgi:alpha-mannosidase
VNGQEEAVGPAGLDSGQLATSFGPYQPRTFAVKLATPSAKAAQPDWKPVALDYDVSVATRDNKPAEGCFDCDPNEQESPQGRALPAEMLPSDVAYSGVQFHLGTAGNGTHNALTAQGQGIALPSGKFNRIYLLAAAFDGDQTGTFQVESDSTASRTDLKIEDWSGFIGQWDTRTWNERTFVLPTPPEPAANDHSPRAERIRQTRARVKERGPETRTEMEYSGMKPGYIKRAPVAWFASHNHAPDGSNQAYSYCYLFAYEMDLPEGATRLTLPNNPHIRILGATVANEPEKVSPAWPLYDTIDRSNVDMSRWKVAGTPALAH